MIICVLLAWVYCTFVWLFLLAFDFSFLSTNQEIGWEEHHPYNLFCVSVMVRITYSKTKKKLISYWQFSRLSFVDYTC